MYIGFVIKVIHFLVLVVPILINVAIVTLLERKFLAGTQIRRGPIKNGVIGIFQPFADVVKLFGSQISSLVYNINYLYLVRPIIRIFIALMFLLVLPIKIGHSSWEFRFLYVLILLRLNVYPLLLRGWSSNRTYAFIGSIRGVAQTISYEIRIAFIILRIFSLIRFLTFRKIRSLGSIREFFFFPILFIWVVRIVAELNRTPFDFSEGESELVSGFNVEYGAIKFAIFFIAEYSIIISLRIFSSVIFLQQFYCSFQVLIISIIIIFLIIWLRATYPRYQYDKLINLAWKSLLPWRLGLSQVCCALGVIC